MKKFNFILLIDDDETCNYITKKMISNMKVPGHTQCFRNGKEALAFIEENCLETSDETSQATTSDLILLDISMPVMDGLEFLEELFNHEKLQDYANKINIYMLTSSDSPVDLEKIKHYNIKGYISKPMTPDKLTDLLQS